MRKLLHVSPSMLQTREESEQEFYIKYRSDTRPDREPQTLPMAIGSAFDAEVKAFLLHRFFGKNQTENYERLFEAQVEAHNRDSGRAFGKLYFDQYRDLGGLAEMVLLLERAKIAPLVEIELQKKLINFDGVPIPVIAKPDLAGTGKDEQAATRLVHDWKVNKGSPAAGYVKSLPKGLPHKDTFVINEPTSGIPLATHAHAGAKWDNQLSFYGICLFSQSSDSKAGSGSLGSAGHTTDFVGSIDQITHDGAPGPKTRVNLFRKMFRAEALADYAVRVREFWEAEQARVVSDEWELLALARYGLQRPETDSDRAFGELISG